MATGPSTRPASRPGRAVAAARRVVGWSAGRLPGWLPNPRRTPFTFCYLLLLAATSLVLGVVSAHTARHLLSRSSTDVYHLHTTPVLVLVTSALWLPGLGWLLYAPLFTLVLAPVERRTGPRWVAAVFASGHVAATLLTELPLAWAIRVGYLAPSDQHRLDVGVSYGFHAVLGLLLGLLPRRVRPVAVAAAASVVAVPLLTSDDSLTAFGHVVSLLVGLCWWPWLARRGLVGSLPARRPAHRPRHR